MGPHQVWVWSQAVIPNPIQGKICPTHSIHFLIHIHFFLNTHSVSKTVKGKDKNSRQGYKNLRSGGKSDSRGLPGDVIHTVVILHTKLQDSVLKMSLERSFTEVGSVYVVFVIFVFVGFRATTL